MPATRQLALALLLLPRPGLGDAGFSAARDQGLHYLRMKMLPAAQARLEEAAAMPGGDRDFATWSALARVYHKQLLLERAFPAARKAAELASSDQDRRVAADLLRRLEDYYGGVALSQAPEQQGQVKRGYVHLEDRAGLINPEKKDVFQRIRQRFKETPIELPLTLYLPFGSYTANLAPFDIKKGETAKAVTFLYVPDTEGKGISPWWYVGGGVVAAAAATTAAVLLLDTEPPERRVRLSGVRLTEPAGAQPSR